MSRGWTKRACARLLIAGTWPLLVALASVRAGPHHDSLVGLTIAAGALGCIAAPPLMNRLLGGLPPRLVFAVMALPLALAAVLVLRLPARKPAAVYPSEPMPPKGGARGEGAAYS
jgi:MFS family permease